MTTDGFYTIQEFDCTEATGNQGSIKAAVLLDRGHWICRAHFPGKPIMPGAMILQTLQELVSKGMGRRYVVSYIRNVKFSAPVLPEQTEELVFDIEYGFDGEHYGLSAKCSVSEKDTKFSNLSVELIPVL